MCALCMLHTAVAKGFLASLHFVKLTLPQQSCVDRRYLALKWSSDQKRTVSYKAHQQQSCVDRGYLALKWSSNQKRTVSYKAGQQLAYVPSLNQTYFTSDGVGVWLCELTKVWVATL